MHAVQDSNVKFAKKITQSRFETVPYRTMYMMSRERVSCPGTAIGQIGGRSLQSQDYKNIILPFVVVSPKPEGILSMRSILSVPASVLFLFLLVYASLKL